MDYLSCVCARAVSDLLKLYPAERDAVKDFAPLESLLRQCGPAAWARAEKKQNDLSRLRFSLLAQEYCAGPGQPAAAEALRCAVAAFLYPSFAALVQRCTGGVCDFPLAWRMADCGSVWDAADHAAHAFERVRLFLPALRRDMAGSALVADERLVRYLCGGDEIDTLVAEVAQFAPTEPPAPLYARGALLRSVCEALTEAYENGDLLHLEGAAGCGKRLLMCHAAFAADRALLMVDCHLLAANPLKSVWAMLDSIRREALFHGACVCFSGAQAFADRALQDEKNTAWEQLFFHLCAKLLLAEDIPVCICTDKPAWFLPWAGRPVRRLAVSEYTRGEQILLWEGFAAQYAVTLNAAKCGSKYKLSGAQIEIAVRQLARISAAPTEAQIAQVCDETLPPPSQGSIRRIRAQYTLDDLKLPEIQKDMLRQLCAHVLYRHEVYDRWNMESRFAYGKCVSALLVGPPGTGKTMAVQVLSNLLDIPLYRIDLSQVVDKYIGETEKRLEDIFTAAEKSNTILFFDEADAIFGKRSEVNDSKDKYANTEVSYILQRIEQYDGIVILATNYKKNIDEAFMRRMRYLIEFQLPGESLRLAIWKGAFAPEVPLGEVDFAYLARQFELSGGSIKNIALNAVFLAAAEGCSVEMRHILSCVRSENAKVGKPMLRQDFAEYGGLLD